MRLSDLTPSEYNALRRVYGRRQDGSWYEWADVVPGHRFMTLPYGWVFGVEIQAVTLKDLYPDVPDSPDVTASNVS